MAVSIIETYRDGNDSVLARPLHSAVWLVAVDKLQTRP